MWMKNGKKPKKRDLLEMPEVERAQVIKEVKESLRQKAVEAKLWQTLVEAQNLTINGDKVYCDDIQSKGVSIQELLKNM